MVNNVEALRKWNKLDKTTQEKILTNVYCINCQVTTIVNYEITERTLDEYGCILRPK